MRPLTPAGVATLRAGDSPVEAPRVPLPPRVDVLVAGASFAGLAAARSLGPRALVVDRAPVGANQTSACGAPISIVERVGAEGSILQRHDRLIITIGSRSVTWPLPEPFCTFDYAAYCRLALDAGGAAFTQASVQSVEESLSAHGTASSTVRTSAGAVHARFVVDATGPRSALAGGRTAARGRRLAFGLEAEIPYPMGEGLYFYFLPEVRDGYAWAFPCSDVTRFGVLSYLGRTRLGPALDTFLARFGVERNGRVHGGYLATGLSPSVSGSLFAAGDAGGHCLPLTGEGIRTAVLAGETCGALLRGVLQGDLSAAEAARRYRAFTIAHARRYRVLVGSTVAAMVLPHPLLYWLARTVAAPSLLARFFRNYLSIFVPDGGRDA